MSAAYDMVLVGGGLANGLLALRLRERRPELKLLVLEAGDSLGGNHTWSFHATDLTPEQGTFIDPLVVHRWPAYDVAFEGFRRRLDIPYRSVTSERFHAVLMAELDGVVRLQTPIRHIEPHRVVLEDGREIAARAVVDGRGAGPAPGVRFGWQVFLGQELRFARPHGLTVPIVMDATVAQIGGYHFVYVLPHGPDTALVEDTYYADQPGLDVPELRNRIAAYARANGWTIAEVLREETGILPITLAGSADAYWQGDTDLPRTGLRAGLFHQTTGYSLPDAVRLADHVCALPDLEAEAMARAIRAFSMRRWREQRLFRVLNRMLFLAAAPPERAVMLARFYRMPESTIRRFYAGMLSTGDKVRLLVGRPPIPIPTALRAILAPEFRA